MSKTDVEPDQLATGATLVVKALRAHLVEALAQGRLQSVLGALRGLEHAAGLVGLSAASEAFAHASQGAPLKG